MSAYVIWTKSSPVYHQRGRKAVFSSGHWSECSCIVISPSAFPGRDFQGPEEKAKAAGKRRCRKCKWPEEEK